MISPHIQYKLVRKRDASKILSVRVVCVASRGDFLGHFPAQMGRCVGTQGHSLGRYRASMAREFLPMKYLPICAVPKKVSDVQPPGDEGPVLLLLWSRKLCVTCDVCAGVT